MEIIHTVIYAYSFTGRDRICTSRDRVLYIRADFGRCVGTGTTSKREVINSSVYQPVYETLCRLINAKFFGGCWLSQPSDDFLTQRQNSHVGWVHEHIVWFKRKRGTSLVDRSVVIELGIKFGWTWIQTCSLWVCSMNLNRPSADVGNGERSVSQWTVFLDFDCLARFLSSAAKLMRSALFRAITQLIVVIYYRRFGTTSLSHPHGQEIQETLSWISLPWPWDREVVPKRR